MITMAPVQQKNNKYNLKFKLYVIRYGDENSGEQLLAEGCQRIHREAGKVCDIFIADLCEEGIKRLSQIASLSQINAWSVK